MSSRIFKFLPYTIVWLSLYSINSVVIPERPNLGFLGGVALFWPIGFSMVFLYFMFSRIFVSTSQLALMNWLKLFLFWNIIEILIGAIVADGYWDWKGLTGNALVLILPLIAFSATNLRLVQELMNSYIRFALPLAILLFWTIAPYGFGYYLAPFAYLLLFFNTINRKWKIICILITILVLVADIDARSNVIKFTVPLAILIFSFFWNSKKIFLLRWLQLVFFIIPILLFSLGVIGIFNVFKIDEYVKGEYLQEKRNKNGELVSVNLKADTRTGLYIEVLQGAKKYDSWVFGRTPARGNETELFSQLSSITGKKERIANEVAILNIFNWTGIIGVLLYMMVFYKASFLAINYSKNSYSKLIGLYIAFRWIYAWVEDINNFSLNYFMLWLFIGLCYSNEFRGMTNQEVKWWVRGFFDRKYRYTVHTNRAEVLA